MAHYHLENKEGEYNQPVSSEGTTRTSQNKDNRTKNDTTNREGNKFNYNAIQSSETTNHELNANNNTYIHGNNNNINNDKKNNLHQESKQREINVQPTERSNKSNNHHQACEFYGDELDDKNEDVSTDVQTDPVE